MSEHPMQAESTVQSPKNFWCVSRGEAPLPLPFPPPLYGITMYRLYNPELMGHGGIEKL